MKYIFSLLFSFFFFNHSFAAINACQRHWEEIREIRSISYNAFYDSLTLGKAFSTSVVFTKHDMAWDEVKYCSTYSDFSNAFKSNIIWYNQYGKFSAANRLYTTFHQIGDMFLKLYGNCILNHHNYRSLYERSKIHFDRGNLEECFTDVLDLIDADVVDSLITGIKPTDLLVIKGDVYIEIGEYEKAIQTLSEALKNDSKNKDIYFSRALAYFEMGNFEAALDDYLMSKKGRSLAKSTYEVSKEFTTALLLSAASGAGESAIDFVPTLCSTVYGLSKVLWITVQHPIESTKNFAGDCYVMGECIFEYCKNIDRDTLDNCTEQIRNYYENFDKLTQAEKGDLIGHTIGKYGIDIFAGGTAVKGIAAYRNLKTANRVCNLEAMALSASNKEAVIASSLKHAVDRDLYFTTTKINWNKQGKHIPTKHNFIKTKGIITLEELELETLIRKNSGKGQRVSGCLGEPNYKERVDFGKIIGEYALQTPGEHVKHIPTTKGIIHYAKDGSMHMVPSNPTSIMD